MFLSRIDIIHKGLDILFPAIASFNSSSHNSNVEFHFYGKARVPEFEKQFNNFISQADKNVFFHGPVVDDNKVAAFKNADIFILTSRYEGMPMAILEALSFGLPCLLTRYTNMADIIKDNQCGWITDLSVEGIRNTIQMAIEDFCQHKESLVNNSLKAAEMFTWKTVAQNSILEYKRLIG